MTDLERLKLYDEELSAVIPLDFKDWHQNSKDERPEVARWVIENLRKDREWCYEVMDKQALKIKELESEIEYLRAECAGEDL
jgi:hypothetical protein